MGARVRLFGVAFGLLVLTMGCSGPQPTVEEKKALIMFQTVQERLEESPSFEAFNRLLAQTESD